LKGIKKFNDLFLEENGFTFSMKQDTLLWSYLSLSQFLSHSQVPAKT